jgi:hypothetical protein
MQFDASSVEVGVDHVPIGAFFGWAKILARQPFI